MDPYGPSTYGDRIADAYDSWFHPPTDVESAVEVLAGLAGPGPALELGIGTGRIALPLAARGVAVHGVDASQAMVDKLRDKPGGGAIPVALGDFADVPVDGLFPLIYIVFNTLFGLLTQDDQKRCLRNVAAHLGEGGVFVVETFVPDIARFDRGQRVQVARIDLDHAFIDVSMHDPEHQRVSAQIIVLEAEGRFRLFPVELRYLWPSELDLLAELAGLRLRDRWRDWDRTAFTGVDKHISVFEKAAV
jgi:SAM-dependent methyltransferase